MAAVGSSSSSKELIAAVRREARRAMQDGRGSHGYDHVRRVLALSLHLGRESGADPQVLTLAALLHDIARPAEARSNGETCHAEEGSRLAGKILARHGAPAPLVRRVKECVRAHRYRGRRAPRSLEAKILFDADKLDSLGAVGIGRAFLFAGEVGARLHNSVAEALEASSYSSGDTAYREYLVKLRHLEGKMMTAGGRRLARERAAFMEEFFRRLNLETRGRA